jgi:very-long-chain enoyl-CoA reductase
MPLQQLFTNCSYYWGFAAAVGYPLVHAAFTAPSKLHVAFGTALWVVSQLVNLAVHVQLSSMRGGDSDIERAPPVGILFSLVTCPNYTAEFLGWVAWSLVSHVAAGYFFTAAGLYQMTLWAWKKKKMYKESGAAEYAKQRKGILPFLF